MFSKFMTSMIAAGTAGIVGYCIVMLVRYLGSGSWPVTSGRVESYDRPTYMNARRGVCFTSVRYSYSVGASDYRGGWLTPQLRNEAALTEFLEKEMPIGKSVEVRYKPEAPNRSELANPPELTSKDVVQQTKFSEL